MSDLKKLDAKSKVEWIVNQLRERAGMDVSYTWFWVGWMHDDLKVWEIGVASYPSSIKIPNKVIERLSFEKVEELVDVLCGEVVSWEANFGKLKDKVVDIEMELEEEEGGDKC